MTSLLSSLSPLSAILGNTVNSIPIVFLYIGPETMLPLASFVAGVIGVILVFWRVIVAGIRKLLGKEPADISALPDDIDADFSITSASQEQNAKAPSEVENG